MTSIRNQGGQWEEQGDQRGNIRRTERIMRRTGINREEI